LVRRQLVRVRRVAQRKTRLRRRQPPPLRVPQIGKIGNFNPIKKGFSHEKPFSFFPLPSYQPSSATGLLINEIGSSKGITTICIFTFVRIFRSRCPFYYVTKGKSFRSIRFNIFCLSIIIS